MRADVGGQPYDGLSPPSNRRSARKLCAVPPQALWQRKSSPQCACGPLWPNCIGFLHRTAEWARTPCLHASLTHLVHVRSCQESFVRCWWWGSEALAFALTRREVQPGRVLRRSTFWRPSAYRHVHRSVRRLLRWAFSGVCESCSCACRLFVFVVGRCGADA